MRTRYKQIIRSVIPAILFMVIYKFISFKVAVVIGFTVGLFMYIHEYNKNKKLSSFSYLGIFSLICQTIMSLFAQNPKTYFVYPLIFNLIYAIIFGVSLIIKRDMISFFAKDMCETEEEFEELKPAFRYVTLLWFIFFLIKIVIKVVGLLNWSFEILYIVNWIVGTPMSLILIWYSFEYPEKYYIRMQKLENKIYEKN